MNKIKMVVCHTDPWFLSHFQQYVVSHHGEMVSCQTYSAPEEGTLSKADLILLEEGLETGQKDLPVQYLSSQRKEEMICLFQPAEAIYQQAMQCLESDLKTGQAVMGKIQCFYLPGVDQSEVIKVRQIGKAISEKETVLLLDLSQCNGRQLSDESTEFADVLYQLHMGSKNLLSVVRSLIRQEDTYMTLGPLQNPFLIAELSGSEWLELMKLIQSATDCDQLIVQIEFLTKGLMDLMKHSSGIYSFGGGSESRTEHFMWVLEQMECRELYHQIEWEEETAYDRDRIFIHDTGTGIKPD